MPVARLFLVELVPQAVEVSVPILLRVHGHQQGFPGVIRVGVGVQEDARLLPQGWTLLAVFLASSRRASFCQKEGSPHADTWLMGPLVAMAVMLINQVAQRTPEHTLSPAPATGSTTQKEEALTLNRSLKKSLQPDKIIKLMIKYSKMPINLI